MDGRNDRSSTRLILAVISSPGWENELGIYRVLTGFDGLLAIFCRRNEHVVGTWARMNDVQVSFESPGEPLCLAGADRLVAFWDGEDPAVPAAVADAKERGIPTEVWL